MLLISPCFDSGIRINMKTVYIQICVFLIIAANQVAAKSTHRVAGLNPAIAGNGSQCTKGKTGTELCEDESACCRPMVRCPAHVRLKPAQFCTTPQGGQGVCCTTGSNHTEPMDEKRRGHKIIKADLFTLSLIRRKSREELADLRTREAKLMSSGKHSILSRSSSSYSHFRNSRTFNSADLHQVMEIASRALEIAIATRAFRDRYNNLLHPEFLRKSFL